MRNRDLIKQYVNTGNPITEYQINKLNKSLLNSYFRKRIIAAIDNDYLERSKQIQPHEYAKMDELQRNKVFPHIEITHIHWEIGIQQPLQDFINKWINYTPNDSIERMYMHKYDFLKYILNYNKDIIITHKIVDYLLEHNLHQLYNLIKELRNRNNFYDYVKYFLECVKKSMKPMGDRIQAELRIIIKERGEYLKLEEDKIKELIKMV